MALLTIDNLYKDLIGGRQLLDQLTRFHEGKQASSTFPPYDIIETDTGYAIKIAVAGFDKSEITISEQEGGLTIVGNKTDKTSVKYIYCGIAARSFERRFMLWDNIIATGADYNNGILTIKLESIKPEKPKQKFIAIQ